MSVRDLLMGLHTSLLRASESALGGLVAATNSRLFTQESLVQHPVTDPQRNLR